jgi:uncharacterized protein YndB with AHSA1/START domain
MDIIHELQIETTPERVFEALSTDNGIAAWWTKAKTQAKVGGINEFDFRGNAVTFRVEKLEPGKAVGWSAEEVPPDWKGTRVLFEVSKAPVDKRWGAGHKGHEGSVVVRFSHTGFKEMTPLVAFSSYAWAQFLRSLKLFLETGKGEPFGSPPSLAAGTTPRE